MPCPTSSFSSKGCCPRAFDPSHPNTSPRPLVWPSKWRASDHTRCLPVHSLYCLALNSAPVQELTTWACSVLMAAISSQVPSPLPPVLWHGLAFKLGCYLST